MSITRGVLAQSPEPEAHDKVLDNNPDRMEMLVFEERGKPEYPEKNLSEQGRETATNSTHIWRRVWESNPGHIGGRPAWEVNAQPLRHPCSPWQAFKESQKENSTFCATNDTNSGNAGRTSLVLSSLYDVWSPTCVALKPLFASSLTSSFLQLRHFHSYRKLKGS